MDKMLMKEIEQQIINRILYIMKSKKINAKKLVIDLELANNAVSEWKKGKIKPSIGLLKIISQYLNVSSDYLLGLTDNPEINK